MPRRPIQIERVSYESIVPAIARLGPDRYLVNSGRVGGPASEERSREITAAVTEATVRAAEEGSLEWELDPDFGWEIAVEAPDGVDIDLLRPRDLYVRTDGVYEYAALVPEVRKELGRER